MLQNQTLPHPATFESSNKICQKCLYNKLRSKEEEEDYDDFQKKKGKSGEEEFVKDLRIVFDCSNTSLLIISLVSDGKELT